MTLELPITNFGIVFIMVPPTVQEVLDKISTSNFKLTLNFLINHESCDNPNENSIKCAINRVQVKVSSLRNNSKLPKRKAELDAFLLSPFPFPTKGPSSTAVKS